MFRLGTHCVQRDTALVVLHMSAKAQFWMQSRFSSQFPYNLSEDSVSSIRFYLFELSYNNDKCFCQPTTRI